ncbi:hypothetical protein DdX_13322 [Ditylenchus destructor]|uniref:SXP/RAL-2 family protein Ani s 5-like cation-binding domain-containing protein n=1 Tax=Ditylenchus destructor TaxID=166010 RepID=A0AAD4MWW0_9BILA|nr:hypothetical protein DdX_13322 [Ditylenchus destructor]
MGAYLKIKHPENSYARSNTFKILVILSLIFGLAVGLIFGLFLARLPFSKIFTYPVEQQEDKTVVDNRPSHPISHHHSNDTVKVHSQLTHPKPSRRGRPGTSIYTCRHENGLSLFPYKANYSFTAHRPPWLKFLRHLDSDNQTLYLRIKTNATLSKGEIADEIEIWLQTQAKKVQATYTEWQANVTQKREKFAESVKANLSVPAIELFHKILSIVDDRSLTRSETIRRIDEFILNSTIKPWLELNRALGKAVCHRFDISQREEVEAEEELSKIEKSVQQYISVLPMIEDRNNKNKAFNAESGGDTLLEETLKRSLWAFRSPWGMDPVEPAPLEYGRSTNNQ